MPAKPQPERPSESRAWQLMNELPWTPENRLTIARAFLDEEGDVPQETLYGFMTIAPSVAEADAIQREIMALREAHFARLGKPVPEYQSNLR